VVYEDDIELESSFRRVVDFFAFSTRGAHNSISNLESALLNTRFLLLPRQLKREAISIYFRIETNRILLAVHPKDVGIFDPLEH
jgi:hypothetical protein